MTEHIDSRTLKHLQSLTHIHLSQEEEIKLHESLNSIIDMLNQLQSVDVENIDPLTHPIDGHIMKLGSESDAINYTDTENILRNVNHRMINNAIKIKSMIDQEAA